MMLFLVHMALQIVKELKLLLLLFNVYLLFWFSLYIISNLCNPSLSLAFPCFNAAYDLINRCYYFLLIIVLYVALVGNSDLK